MQFSLDASAPIGDLQTSVKHNVQVNLSFALT